MSYVSRIVGTEPSNGFDVAVNMDGEACYVTPCCSASAKGCDGYTGCRACYREVDPGLGNLPPAEWWAPHQRYRLEEFADFLNSLMRKSLGLPS